MKKQGAILSCPMLVVGVLFGFVRNLRVYCPAREKRISLMLPSDVTDVSFDICWLCVHILCSNVSIFKTKKQHMSLNKKRH